MNTIVRKQWGPPTEHEICQQAEKVIDSAIEYTKQLISTGHGVNKEAFVSTCSFPNTSERVENNEAQLIVAEELVEWLRYQGWYAKVENTPRYVGVVFRAKRPPLLTYLFKGWW